MSKMGGARRRAALALVALVAACPAAAGARCRAGDTGVLRVSGERGFAEAEEPLSVNPRNPREMTTVANVFQPIAPLSIRLDPLYGGGGVQDTRVFSTRDGGCHWSTLKLDQGGLGSLSLPLSGGGNAPEFSDALNVLNTDADSEWDRHGNAYFESGDVHGIFHDGQEVETVWRSSDGGAAWGPPRGYTAINATTQEHTELDRPWLAVDNSGGPHDGRIYTTFETTAFLPTPPAVFIKHSDDRGVTWSKSVRVDDGLYETQWNPRARPVVGAGGIVYVVYDRAQLIATPLLPYGGPIELVVARSLDGGQTFQRLAVDSGVRRVTSPDEALPEYTEMIAAIAADPLHAGHIAVAWPQAYGPNNSRILLRYSRDGGLHWSPRIDVARDSATRSDQHDHVTLSWARDGRLFVGWRDRQCCGGGWSDNYQEWVRVLNPRRSGGFALGRTVQFTAGPQPPAGGGRGALEPDEFQGLVADPLGVSLTWSQLGSDGLAHLMFRRVPLRRFAQHQRTRSRARRSRPAGDR